MSQARLRRFLANVRQARATAGNPSDLTDMIDDALDSVEDLEIGNLMTTELANLRISDESWGAAVRSGSRTFPVRRRRARLAKKLRGMTAPTSIELGVEIRLAGSDYWAIASSTTVTLSRKWSSVYGLLPCVCPGDHLRFVSRIVQPRVEP